MVSGMMAYHDHYPMEILESPQGDRAVSAAFDPERDEAIVSVSMGGVTFTKQPKTAEQQLREEITSLRKMLADSADRILKARQLIAKVAEVLN